LHGLKNIEIIFQWWYARIIIICYKVIQTYRHQQELSEKKKSAATAAVTGAEAAQLTAGALRWATVSGGCDSLR
jgi:hypothetical protein